MRIRFNKNIELEAVTGMEDDVPQTEPAVFLEGEETDIDICDDKQPPDAAEIQFGDGSVSFVTPPFWADVTILSHD
jgi:hypothetical protein